VAIKNRQSRDTGNIRHTRHMDKYKQNKKHNKTQKIKKMSNSVLMKKMQVTPDASKMGKQFLLLIKHQKTTCEPRVSSSCFL